MSELKPNHRQLCHRKLYVYKPRVYCTFTRDFTSGHGLMCTVMVTLGSCYSLQCFAICFDILVHLDSPKFYSRPATCIRQLKFLLDFSMVGDSPKFYATNVSRCTVFSNNFFKAQLAPWLIHSFGFFISIWNKSKVFPNLRFLVQFVY